ncbi:type II secretion system F family protein [Flexibacterium corallicola]|uniref:type II secretion system F family protein n=1 Tax=Flexibacterium corallicola TaxID=3037259 RepID=UPI00286F38DE|nr:type II secretion system F family protein [Pseudovibrio sp. M1P-2-3]
MQDILSSFPPIVFQMIVGVLVALCVGGLSYAILYPTLSGTKQQDERLGAVANSGSLALSQHKALRENQAKKTSVQSQLKAHEEKQEALKKKAKKPTFTVWMAQAGLNWSRKKFYIISAISAVVFCLASYLTQQHTLVSIGALFVGGLGMPRLFVARARKRRFAAFLEEFPNAIDIIVRGVKSGLPLTDCLKVISKEAKEPVASEFARIVETQNVGVALGEAVMGMNERVPLPDIGFFAIVISIQSKSGGGLSEALGNLSKVLRDRKAMKGKVKAVSSEAKSSAAIIGCLPVIVAGLVYLVSPEYILLLFNDIRGNIMLVIGAVWMLIGVVVMSKMINFDI